MTSEQERSEADDPFAAMEAEQRREYQTAGTTDADGSVFDPDALADDSENAGLDDSDPNPTSLI